MGKQERELQYSRTEGFLTNYRDGRAERDIQLSSHC